MKKHEIIIKETHRALWYEDGVLVKILEAGRYEFSPGRHDFWGRKRPAVEFVLVDVRERELTIKGQEILTADKVAIRVSIIVHFRVTDPKAAIHKVEKYEERLYSDVQLAARRSLASMKLEEILTNRSRLSEDILHDVQEIAAEYGVSILRADVKDLIFPGNLQEIMNKVLAAERLSEAQLVEARTKAHAQQIEADARAQIRRVEAEAEAKARQLKAEADAASERVRMEAEIASLLQTEQVAQTYSAHPSLLRLRELEALKDLAQLSNARIYVSFNKRNGRGDEDDD